MTALPLEGLKVVSSDEMARIEQLAYAEGASEVAFMEKAGEAVALAVEHFVVRNKLPKIATLLVGKGNNGGDAYAAGARLMQKGFKIIAFHLFALEECGALCKAMHEKFRSHGAHIQYVQADKEFKFEFNGVIVDGLVGTGFKGSAQGMMAHAIESANASGHPILAIDIPSGLNGNTGEVGTAAICSTETIFLGLPKIGFFLKEGWTHVGKLRYATFGLKQKFIEAARPIAYLLNEDSIVRQFPPIKRTRHKYEAGYVLAVAGSPGMSGAAILSATAALKSGAGIVRLFHPRGMQAELSSAPWELIREEYSGKRMDGIKEQAKRAKVMLIGPGIGRKKEMMHLFYLLLSKIDLPMVIDADALFFLTKKSAWKFPPGSVITPHRGEMNLLLGKALSLPKDEMVYRKLCQKYAEEKKVTVVLKGAPTFIFHPQTFPLIVTHGDPGMATAGSGDVLTGMIAAMIAQGLETRQAAALAVYLHGKAGELAAQNLTSYCMTASDLIDFFPDAFACS